MSDPGKQLGGGGEKVIVKSPKTTITWHESNQWFSYNNGSCRTLVNAEATRAEVMVSTANVTKNPKQKSCNKNTILLLKLMTSFN
jgi:hypothetical protein